MKSETRSFPRKILRAPARVALPGRPPLRAKTVDISLGGVSVIVADQFPIGQICSVAFEAPVNDNIVRVTATTRVIYSILTGTEGFRTGLQIIEIDAANNKTLAELMM
jgi:c-di-GMP-binding flagellar brake protein YcgR